MFGFLLSLLSLLFLSSGAVEGVGRLWGGTVPFIVPVCLSFTASTQDEGSVGIIATRKKREKFPRYVQNYNVS